MPTPRVLTTAQVKKKGWAKGVKRRETFDRLDHILPTLNIAEGMTLMVSGKRYGPSDRLATAPKWRQRKDNPLAAELDVAVHSNGSQVAKGKVGVAWLAFDEDRQQHDLVGFDIKVDGEGNLYALGRYGSVASESTCIRCGRIIVCGVEPTC